MQNILNKSPSISIVIPCYNAESTLVKCLEAIKYAISASDEIIVVNDASTDKTKLLVENYKIVHLQNDEQMGPSYCRNLGMLNARNDLVIFIDADIEIMPESIEISRKYMCNNPLNHGFTGILSKNHTNKNFFSLYKNYYLHFIFMQVKGEAHFLYGSFCGLRKSTGFIWPNNIRYGEDTWLGNQMAQRGNRIALLKDVQVIHHKFYNLYRILINDFTIPYFFCQTFAYNLDKKIFIRNFSHTNLKQLLAISAVGLTVLLSLLHLSVYAIIALFSWSLFNASFFKDIAKNTDIFFTIRSIFFTFLDQFVMGTGIFAGLFYFVFIKRVRSMINYLFNQRSEVYE